MEFLKQIPLVASILAFSLVSIAQQSISQVWVADQKDGTYKNPILHSDYSDPDVVGVNGDYYMTSSSFNAAPGLPVLHSRDLVNWKLINYALPRQFPDEVFSIPQHGNGVWAPSIRYHNEEFYIFWGDPDQGIFRIKTKDPRGEWEEPVLVFKAKGVIDPCPLWDDDGNAYLVHGWAGSRAGVKSLLTVHKMNAEATKVLDAGKHVFDGHENHPTVEGSKFYKRNGYYYIFAPAGGVSTGWQLILRSKNVYGPYEEQVVLEQGSTPINGPHQGAWVATAQGEDWSFHFQDKDAYGRVVHLQPMSWKNDWPVMGKDFDNNGIGEPVLAYTKPKVDLKYPIATPPETDEFNTDTLGIQWQWQANPNVMWSAQIRGKEYLRLFSIKPETQQPNLWVTPNLFLQKFPSPQFTATTVVKLEPEEAITGKRAGLMIFGMHYATLTLTHDNDGFFIEQTQALDAESGADEFTNEVKRIATNTAYFKVEVSAPDATCRFSYSEDGKAFKKIGKEFTAKPGKWVGAKVGIFSVSSLDAKRGGYADFDFFRITK
ncbi:glycoside hydrolase 43 family protein [Leeuwenhoekiella sp. NPDC079379]|uniref:glycoside hydrolase 43 family protein n=1 Tax=Leeuwenhoekiella sp. NPDC079379 TaxID=3364122 RepID=UPI0037C859CD